MVHSHELESMKKTRTLFGVDSSKNFGVIIILDLCGEGNDVCKKLTIICATAGVEIKIEPFELLQPEGCKNYKVRF